MHFDRLKRRQFITLVGGAAAWPVAARAQRTGSVRRIGVLMNGNERDPVYRAYVAAFVQALQRLGWLEGQNLRIDFRWPPADPERIGAYAAELVGMTPDVILCSGSASLAALLRTTRSIKAVFVLVSDPVAQGFVTNLAHPGGNVTGFSAFEPSTAGKWLDLLKQASPGLTRVAVIFNPDTSPQSKLFVPAIEAAASSLAVEVVAAPVHATGEFEPLLASFSRRPNGGLIFPSDQFLTSQRGLILELVTRHRLPAVYASETFARNGGLIYYGTDWQNQFRQAAIYVDRILKGTNPGDLPVQQPTKFPLIINLAAARVLGIELPIALLLSADEVIE
jgi:putative tryptophan/tyrosine transport system substrate-binding protein